MPTLYLLDGNIITALTQLNPVTRQYIAALSPDDEMFTCFIVVGEWEYGVLNAPIDRLRQEIRKQGELALSGMSRIIESSPAINRVYGEIAAELRRAGTMIPQNDMWIAAVARVVGATVVTHDNHFRKVKNLPVVDWTKDA